MTNTTISNLQQSLDDIGRATSRPSIRSGPIPQESLTGSIASQIGTGEHAKDSFIWATLKYCFLLGALFSIIMLFVYLYFSLDKNTPEKINIISDLKDIWSIFTPILTLALGYAFG
ncbi:TPA: hypothetical protein JD052_005174, partial [Citrobacter freundii]|nr:hypothetical protein [Citrobacter freundii]